MRKALAPVLALSVMLASFAPILARAQQGGTGAVATVRDAETESLLRAVAHPLFRVAGVDPALVRIALIQARPINAFVTTGNRLFINSGLIQRSAEAGDLAGVLAHETGHIAGGHVARLPEEMRNALFRSLAGVLLGGAVAAELEAGLRIERDNAFARRQLGAARGRLGRGGHADLALAEEAMLTGDFPGARTLARRAEETLPPGPLRPRAADLRHAARRDNMTREQREQENAMRRRPRL